MGALRRKAEKKELSEELDEKTLAEELSERIKYFLVYFQAHAEVRGLLRDPLPIGLIKVKVVDEEEWVSHSPFYWMLVAHDTVLLRLIDLHLGHALYQYRRIWLRRHYPRLSSKDSHVDALEFKRYFLEQDWVWELWWRVVFREAGSG
mgnify:CR=1 FL=1